MAKKKIKCNVELRKIVLDFFNDPTIEDKSHKSLEIKIKTYGYTLEDFKSMVMSLCL